MKNVLIIALVIGLAISLWFNWKGTGKPINNEKYRSIELGKDSLVIEYYFQKPDSVNSRAYKKITDADTTGNKSSTITGADVSEIIGTYATTFGCRDCKSNEMKKDDDCSTISCIVPDMTKQQAIVKGPEHLPAPWLNFWVAKISVKYQEKFK